MMSALTGRLQLRSQPRSPFRGASTSHDETGCQMTGDKFRARGQTGTSRRRGPIQTRLPLWVAESSSVNSGPSCFECIEEFVKLREHMWNGGHATAYVDDQGKPKR